MVIGTCSAWINLAYLILEISASVNGVALVERTITLSLSDEVLILQSPGSFTHCLNKPYMVWPTPATRRIFIVLRMKSTELDRSVDQTRLE